MDKRKLTVQVDPDLYKKMKLEVVKRDTTITSYILDLIKKDLESNNSSNDPNNN